MFTSSSKKDKKEMNEKLLTNNVITHTDHIVDEKDIESDTVVNTLINSNKDSKDPFLNRGITFTRGFTIDTTNSFRRTFTQTLGLEISEDVEEEWTRSLLESYHAAATRGPEGTIPLPVEFARNYEFWKAFAVVGLIGAILGLIALGFLNIVDYTPRFWANNFYASKGDDYFSCPDCLIQNGCTCHKYENCQYYAGQLYWVFITTFTGLIVGLLRFYSSYPENLPGLFMEIQNYHVDPTWVIHSFFISMISLAGGSSLGPEQALASIGGGLATFLIDKHVFFKDEQYGKLVVLGGMASAVGALFPTPLLGVLMFIELASLPKTYMESTLVMSCGACISFLVYYSMVDISLVESVSSKGGIFAIYWDFSETNCLTAFSIGVISAALGISILLTIGITKQILNRIRIRLHKNKLLSTVVPSCIAGLTIGLINWVLPLTIGNGSMVLTSIISYGKENKLSTSLLVSSGFAKIFLLGISMNGGFVGGFIFPIITIGTFAAVISHQLYPDIPFGLFLGCFIAGLPASICPMPFTLAGLSIYIFYFGLYQTVPIFITTIVSYTLVVGTGFFGALQRRGMKADQERNSENNNNLIEKEIEQRQNEERNLDQNYGVAHYMAVNQRLQSAL